MLLPLGRHVTTDEGEHGLFEFRLVAEGAEVADCFLPRILVKLVILELVEPGVSQGFLRSNPLFHVLLHHPFDELFG